MRKSRSKSKSKKMADISHLLYKSEEEKDEGLCHIQTVLNKYLFDYDEYKRRQKEQGLS